MIQLNPKINIDIINSIDFNEALFIDTTKNFNISFVEIINQQQGSDEY